MPASTPSLTPLRPHPAAPARAVKAVTAGCSLSPDGRLRLAYRISAAPDRLCWDRSREPGRRDELWRHTCCEAFVATGRDHYLELNFSPNGSWAAYGFANYRHRTGPDPDLPPPDIRVHGGTRELGLVAEVRLGGLLVGGGAPGPRIGLAAVVEEAEGHMSYWALHHPAPKPDFHHADGFVFTPAPEQPVTSPGGPAP
jgi:hypothetical protein